MSTYFYLVRINILFLLKHFLLFRGILSLFVFMVAILFRLVETLTMTLSDNNQRDNNAVELVALLLRERMADMVI